MEEIEVHIIMTEKVGDIIVWKDPSYPSYPFSLISLEVACYFDRYFRDGVQFVFILEASDFIFKVLVEEGSFVRFIKEPYPSKNLKAWEIIYNGSYSLEPYIEKEWDYEIFFSNSPELNFWVMMEEFSNRRLKWKS